VSKLTEHDGIRYPHFGFCPGIVVKGDPYPKCKHCPYAIRCFIDLLCSMRKETEERRELKEKEKKQGSTEEGGRLACYEKTLKGKIASFLGIL